MNYLTALYVMVLCCSMATAKDPTMSLEWTLKYMEREIPRDSKESLTEASDYRKHKSDFKEKMTVTIYTEGFEAAAAKASLGDISLRFVLLPTEDGEMRVLCDNGPSGKKGVLMGGIGPTKEIRYGEEIFVGGSASRGRDNTGRVISGQAKAFILVIKQMDRDFSKLISPRLIKEPEQRRGEGEEILPPIPPLAGSPQDRANPTRKEQVEELPPPPGLPPVKAQREEPAKAQREEPAKTVKELQKERIATLEVAADFAADLYRNNRVSHEEVSETRLLLLEARLDAAEKESERITLYKKIVDLLKKDEELADSRFQAQRTSSYPVLKFKAKRLKAEIDLERAKANEAKKAK